MNGWSCFVRLFEELIFVVHAALPAIQVPATNSSRNLELHAKIMSYKLCNYAAWQRVEATVNLNSMNVSERLLVARHKDDSFAKWDPQKAVRKRVFPKQLGKKWKEKNYNHLNATTARFMRLLYFHPYVPQARTYFLLRSSFFPRFYHPRNSRK